MVVYLADLDVGALRHLAPFRVGAASAGVILTDLGILAGLHAACGACVVLALLGAGAFLFTIFAIETSIACARVLACITRVREAWGLALVGYKKYKQQLYPSLTR